VNGRRKKLIQDRITKMKKTKVAAVAPVNAAKAAVAAALFLFLTPLIHAQNYPLLNPGPITEDNTQEIKLTNITMYWEGMPPQGRIRAGEQIILTLRARGWYSQQPASAFFTPPVPVGVILTALELSAAERANGIAVKVRIIPLAAGDIVLPARALLYENTQFNIPLLRLQSSRPRN